MVVGGGIGGPAAAIGLRRIGWDVTVLERAPAFADVGAGISLHANCAATTRHGDRASGPWPERPARPAGWGTG
ncbi:NAD(P)-binding protein [Streptomyces sp. B21-102]|nr:hypothetical protein ASE41_35560 [Streptomyces sp. Root264]